MAVTPNSSRSLSNRSLYRRELYRRERKSLASLLPALVVRGIAVLVRPSRHGDKGQRGANILPSMGCVCIELNRYIDIFYSILVITILEPIMSGLTRHRSRGVGMEPSMEALSQLIRSERAIHGWSQDELAKRSGVSRKTISDIENGSLKRAPH